MGRPRLTSPAMFKDIKRVLKKAIDYLELQGHYQGWVEDLEYGTIHWAIHPKIKAATLTGAIVKGIRPDLEDGWNSLWQYGSNDEVRLFRYIEALLWGYLQENPHYWDERRTKQQVIEDLKNITALPYEEVQSLIHKGKKNVISKVFKNRS